MVLLPDTLRCYNLFTVLKFVRRYKMGYTYNQEMHYTIQLGCSVMNRLGSSIVFVCIYIFKFSIIFFFFRQLRNEDRTRNE